MNDTSGHDAAVTAEIKKRKKRNKNFIHAHA
jgi:hypothetical protein